LPCFQPQCGQFPFSAGTASWQALLVTTLNEDLEGIYPLKGLEKKYKLEGSYIKL
jgi:hypothetical protein